MYILDSEFIAIYDETDLMLDYQVKQLLVSKFWILH